MPGRVGRRSVAPRQSNASPRKSNVQTRIPTINVPDEGPPTSLRKAIVDLFGDAQRSTASHRRLVGKLRKVQEACCFEGHAFKIGRSNDDYDCNDFNNEVLRCVYRVLPVKKSETAGDRIVRFVMAFTKAASNADIKLAETEDDLELDELPTASLLDTIFRKILPHVAAKDKIVRFRAVQIIAQLVNCTPFIDAELSDVIRLALQKRIHDKEVSIRTMAVVGLCSFAQLGGGDSDGDDTDDPEDYGAKSVLQKLIARIQHDPSPEVRRSAMLNIPVEEESMPFILERARDSDAATRRRLYNQVLPQLVDFRKMKLVMRDKLLRWGMQDRDELVRRATAKLFREKWIEDCAARPAPDGRVLDAEQAPSQENESSQDPDTGDGVTAPPETAVGSKQITNRSLPPSMPALVELIERMHVCHSAVHGWPYEIMAAFWEGRPDYRAHVSFDDDFWTNLNPENMFIARTFNDFSRASRDSALMSELEDKMPVLTKFGYFLEQELNSLVESINEPVLETGHAEDDNDALEQAHETISTKSFIVEQMLSMALTFDYSDDFGMRKMLTLVRDMLAIRELPEDSSKLLVDLLRMLSTDEADFTRLCLEAIADIRDTLLGPDAEKEHNSEDEDDNVEQSFHSAVSAQSGERSATGRTSRSSMTIDADGDTSMGDDDEEQKNYDKILVELKCLELSRFMLENLQCELDGNASLVDLLNERIVPAVKSNEKPVRTQGVVTLGLCALLTENLAYENMGVFLHCWERGDVELQETALHIITDILITHPALVSYPQAGGAHTTDVSIATKTLGGPLRKIYLEALKSEELSVQATGATAVAKLMLGQLIIDHDLLVRLVTAFFDPDTQDNEEFLQALTYFIPVYCHSRAENAAQMVSIAPKVIAKMVAVQEEFNEEQDSDDDREMVSLTHIAGLLADWTDPRKVVSGLIYGQQGEEAQKVERTLHLEFAELVLRRLIESRTNKEERKVLFNVLGKLHVNVVEAEGETIETVLRLLAECAERDIASDAPSRNTISKMQTMLLKLVHDKASAERGVEETGIGYTTMATPRRATGSSRPRRQTLVPSDSDSENHSPVRALAESMHTTQLVTPSIVRTRAAPENDYDSDTTEKGGKYDASQVPDATEMQSLIEDLENEASEEEL